MSLAKFLTTNLQSQTENLVTVTAANDTTGQSLSQVGFTFPAVDKSGNVYQFGPWFKKNATDVSPWLGTVQTESITFNDDVGGNYSETYFIWYDGTSLAPKSYYVWFNESGVNGYDPGVGVQNKSTVVFAADVSGSLAGTYWKVYSATAGYYVWYKVDGQTNTDPAVSGLYSIPVAISANSTAGTIMATTAAVIAATRDSKVFTLATSTITNTLTITNFSYAATTASSDGTTGFAVTNTVSGVSPVAALANFTSLVPAGVTIASAATSTQIATAVASAFTAAGYTSSSASQTASITGLIGGQAPIGYKGSCPTATFAITTAGTEVSNLGLSGAARQGDTLTFPADTAGNYAQTYLLIYDGTSTAYTSYYVYFTETGNLWDPKIGQQESQTITCLANTTTANLSGTYFYVYSATTTYTCWFQDGFATKPTITGTSVPITITSVNAGGTVAAATIAIQTMNGLVQGMAGEFSITNAGSTVYLNTSAYAALTSAADGNTGFSFSVTTAGHAASTALATYTSLIPGGIKVASGNTGAQNATAFINAMNLVPGWVAVTAGGAGVTLTHKSFGSVPATTTGNLPAGASYANAVTGIDPGQFVIPVQVTATTAMTTAAAAKALYNAITTAGANAGYASGMGGLNSTVAVAPSYLFWSSYSTTAVYIRSRWPWPSSAPTAATSGSMPSQWTIATTTTGTATTTANIASSTVTSAVYLYRPPQNQILYLRELQINLIGGSTAMTNYNFFGNSTTALSNGFNVVLQSTTNAGFTTATSGAPVTTTLLTLTPVSQIKSTADMIDGAQCPGATTSAIQATFDIPKLYGKFEIPVDGSQQYQITLNVGDSMSGAMSTTAIMYACISGHIKEPGDVVDAFGNPVGF